MGTEIERKFLVDGPLSFRGRGRVMEQGYLALDADGTEVRIRREDERSTLAVKRGAGMVRTEIEVEVDAGTASALWALTEGRRLSKSRFVLHAGGHAVEIDVYHGPLSGLVVAEVEFASEEAARAFEPPEWFGREITGDARFRNNALARLRAAPSQTD
jgi:CYTH domain-containing protein